MSEKDFFSLMMYSRSGSDIWKKIVYMQTVVKSRMGIGETFIINYVSHLRSDPDSVTKLKTAGLQEHLDEESNIMAKDVKEYCLILCRRIAYFLLTVWKLEIVRMEAEFMQDDNGKVWFTYATKILVRPASLTDIDEELVLQAISLNKQLAPAVHEEDAEIDTAVTEPLSQKS
ncbi:MAG: hypothetical protein V2I33_26340 [Kangiellaceae bacterium]|jgi:hypothetical protein|nr:hypothetical protein [Kangiellaceae bacterium]